MLRIEENLKNISEKSFKSDNDFDISDYYQKLYKIVFSQNNMINH